MQQRSWPERAPASVQPQRQMVDRLDKAVVDELVRGYEAGATGRELAVHFGLARSTVIKMLKEQGVAIRYPRLTADEKVEIIRLYESGVTQVEIAARFERGPDLIWHVLERAGLNGRH